MRQPSIGHVHHRQVAMEGVVPAYRAAQEALPQYANRFSPRTFIQHHLFAHLVLKSMLQLDYRGVQDWLAAALSWGIPSEDCAP